MRVKLTPSERVFLLEVLREYPKMQKYWFQDFSNLRELEPWQGELLSRLWIAMSLKEVVK